MLLKTLLILESKMEEIFCISVSTACLSICSCLAAARKGDMEAQFQVAENYYYGHGVDENEAEAAEWYEKAALQGHVESMMKLGQLYYLGGDGVPEDEDEAKKWYAIAAKAGNKEAKEKLKYFE